MDMLNAMIAYIELRIAENRAVSGRSFALFYCLFA